MSDETEAFAAFGTAALEALLTETFDAVVERERDELGRLLAVKRNRVVLFGAGSLGTRALSCLRSIGVEPLALSDSDRAKWGQIIDGAAVVSPQEAARCYGASALFIVTIWNARQRFAETKARLASMGCENVVPPSPVQWRFPSVFLPFFSLDLPRRVIAERHEVARAGTLWADERSCCEYFGHVRWRLRGELDALPAPTDEEQYFPNCVRVLENEMFIDCGAYDGDTLRALIAHRNGRFRRVVALEPSPENFAKLNASVAGLPSLTRNRIETRACAVGSSRGTARFGGTGHGARITEDGDSVVSVETLDDLCAELGATFIKMDIEGAEADALEGARRTILRDRPVLAVCVYHTASDLWHIPLMLHDLVSEYRMFLRSHQNDGWETVLYAVPAERAAVALR